MSYETADMMPQGFASLNEDHDEENDIESEEVNDILDTNMQNTLMDKETLAWN